ncbi:MAG: hypothetical protein ACLSV0_02070 [Lachnospira eligens]|uniref:hypothetical protein n=1 Tax=Lachnospira TaxID=28050 RepID=UPI003A478734
MAKKHGLAKIVLGVGAAAVAGKVALDKFKKTKERFVKEENDSLDDEIRKYNAIGEKKVIEVEDEVFAGCELKSVASKTVLDLGLAVFEKDVYINFSSNASSVTIILPEGVNATCDISRKIAGVKNLVDNVDEEGIHTVYIIGKAVCSNVEVIPVNFYVDEEDEEDSDFVDEDDCLASDDDFDDDVIFDEKDGDVEVEVKVINEKADGKEEEKPEKEESDDDSEKTETINLEEV